MRYFQSTGPVRSLSKHLLFTLTLMSGLCLAGVGQSQVNAAASNTAKDDGSHVVITDYLGLTWQNELVSQVVQVNPSDKLKNATATVTGPDGKTIVSQVSDVVTNEQGMITSMKVWFLGGVQPYDSSAYKITTGQASNADAPADAASVKAQGDSVQLTSGKVGAKLLNQNKTYETPVEFTADLAPIHGLILASGKTTPAATVVAPSKLKSVKTTIDADGPLFSQVSIQYTFETGYWHLTFKTIAGIPAVLVHEKLDLGDSGKNTYETTAAMTLHLTSKDFTPTQAWLSGIPGVLPEPDLGKRLVPQSWTDTGAISSEKWVSSPANGFTLKDFPEGHLYTVTGWPNGQPRIGSFMRVIQPGGDAIGFFQLKSMDWRNPMSLIFNWSADKGVTLKTGIQTYKQDWPVDGFGGGSPNFTGQTLGVPATTSWRSYGIELTKAQDETVDRLGSLAHTAARTGSFKLDDVRNWFLDMPTSDAAAKETDKKTSKLRELAEKALVEMQSRAKIMQLTGNMLSFSMANHYVYAKHLYAKQFKPASQNLEYMDPADRKKLRSLLAFEAIYQNSGSSFPYGTGMHLNNPNMTVMAIEARAKSASLVQDHPEFKTWGKDSLAMMSAYIERYVFDSGATFENPHYTLGVSMGWILEANNALMDAGIGDGLDNALWRKSIEFTFNWLTPKDLRFSNHRVILPIGNGSYQSVPAQLAKDLSAYLKKTGKDKLASQFAWVANQTLPEKNQIKGIEPLQPELKSVWYKDYGVFMRHGYDTEYETLFHLLAGKALGHYENEADQMTYTLYAKGQPINLSFGNGYFPIFSRPWLRNRVSFDMKLEAFEHDPIGVSNATFQPEVEYANAYRETSATRTLEGEYPDLNEKGGWTPEEGVRFATMATAIPDAIPHTTWRRQIAFMKDADPKGPNYFVIRDRFEGKPTLPTDLSIWFLANKMERKGDVFHFDGQLKVDADVFLHTPADAKIKTDRYGHQQQPYVRLVPDDLAWYPEGKRREEQLLMRAHQPVGKGYLYVVYPRLKDIDAAATYERTGEQTVTVATPLSTDTVTLAGEPVSIEKAGVTANGTAYAIRQFKDGKLKLVNFEGKLTGQYKGQSFTAEGAVTIDLSKDKPAAESKDDKATFELVKK